MKAEPLNCPNCGASIELHLSNTKTIGCHCGAVFDRRTKEMLEHLNSRKFQARSFLELGMIGNIFGQDYQIIGRIHYVNRISEFDREDQEYYNSNWPYDSWILLSQDGSYAYISEDEEAFYFEEPITPEIPGFPELRKFTPGFYAGHGKVLAKETSSSKIAFFEGEFSWQPRIGQKSESTEYTFGGLCFEATKQLDEDGQAKEIEFFQSRKISELALAQGFKHEETVQRIFKEQQKSKEFKHFGNIAMVTALALAIFGFVIKGISPGSHVEVYSSEVSALDRDGKLFGPLNLENEGRVHQVELKLSSMPSNHSLIAGVELLDSDKKVINEIGSKFWIGSGYDGDRHISDKTSFRLSKAGSYTFRLFAEDKKPMNRDMYKVQGTTLSVKILENTMPAYPYFITAFWLLLYGATIRFFKVTNPLYILLGGAGVMFLIIKFVVLLANEEFE